MNVGWIKLHRQILNWEWYSDTNTFRLFLHLLLTANFKDQKYQGKLIKKGSLLTGRDKLSYETGLSVREVRTCLERLKSTNEIAIKSNSKGTEIQVVNYDKYQIETSETTNERPTNDQQTTTIKEGKENKERKEKKNIPDFSDFLAYAIKERPMVDKDKVQAKYDTWVSNGWKDGYDNNILNWKTKLKNTLPHIPDKVDISKMTSEELRIHITKGIAY
jgi:hypothetical protein